MKTFVKKMKTNRTIMSKQSIALKQYFEASGMSYTEIAERLGWSRSMLSNIVTGRTPIGMKRAHKLADVFGFSYQFLVADENTTLELFSTDTEYMASPRLESERSGLCPSPEQLWARIDDLTAQLKHERTEKKALLEIMNNLTAGKQA